LKTHRAITDAIEAGNDKRAREIAARHLADTQTYVLTDEATHPIVATPPHTPMRTREGQTL
jgi:GntR family transcriptional regulator, transcriptional repressor for pyruvate dehydrogenase complex